ncbi:FAD-binding oxidoreductase [Sphingomonas sp. CBMAI 2297]|uniref:FAD-binding oxidoreductase n=1 Tax=Sphingomonas sp. CBMAI 2297 TaxID=2991720 RepID=UPI0024556E5D|nr:FAD-binding oxidoreductase [Sphingomonas sp. CBMAI 2297]MDH4746260.1 FAD-binding oxidoreductase [Sphingomonas sp. CBMAI 2297]
MTGAHASPLGTLAGIVGAAQVLTEPSDLAAYQSDGRGAGGGAPIAVVRPNDADQVSALVRLAAEAGIRLVVAGGRTGLAGASLAADGIPCVLVSLERLAGLIEIDPANRTATVDAGVRLSALNAAAAEHGLFFPIDLGADPAIGGMIASNTGGARLLRYGDVRANLLSVEVVRSDAEGSRIPLGAPLRKNNTGLDLKQLLVGGCGSTGIVTRATVALHPLPAARLTALLALDDPRAALPLLLALERDFGSWLSAFEGMSEAAIRAATDHVPGLQLPFGSPPPYAVLIELSAGAAFDENLLEERLAAALEPFMSGAAASIRDAAIDRRDRLWALRHAIPEGLRANGTVVACDIALRRGDVMAFRERMAGLLARHAPGLVPHDFGHIGDGGLHYNLVWPRANGTPDPALLESARMLIFDTVVEEFGGSFSAEHGIGPRNIASYRRFVPGAVRRLAGEIQDIMAPVSSGRVDFGTTGEGTE